MIIYLFVSLFIVCSCHSSRSSKRGEISSEMTTKASPVPRPEYLLSKKLFFSYRMSVIVYRHCLCSPVSRASQTLLLLASAPFCRWNHWRGVEHQLVSSQVSSPGCFFLYHFLYKYLALSRYPFFFFSCKASGDPGYISSLPPPGVVFLFCLLTSASAPKMLKQRRFLPQP